jgi:hypothetical protein
MKIALSKMEKKVRMLMIEVVVEMIGIVAAAVVLLLEETSPSSECAFFEYSSCPCGVKTTLLPGGVRVLNATGWLLYYPILVDEL